MALAYSTVVRNAMLDAITTAVGASGLVRFYDGVRPASGGTATTLLATLPCSATFAPASSAGVLTLNALTTANAVATSTSTWFRIVTSGGTFVVDGNVGTSGSDFNFTGTAALTTGQPVSATSWTITEGNP